MPIYGILPAQALYPGDLAYMFGGIILPPGGNGITEFADTLTVTNGVAPPGDPGKSREVSLAQPTPSHAGASQRTVTWEVTLLTAAGAQVSKQVQQTAPTGFTFFRTKVTSATAATLILEGAMRNQDSEYVQVDTMTITATSATQIISKMRSV